MSNDFINEKNYTERLSCSPTTKKLLLENCKTLYLRHHPEMEGIPISQGFIIQKVVEYYLS